MNLLLDSGIQKVRIVMSDKDIKERTGTESRIIVRALDGGIKSTKLSFVKISALRIRTNVHFMLYIDTKSGPENRGFVGQPHTLFGNSSFRNFEIKYEYKTLESCGELDIGTITFVDCDASNRSIPVAAVFDIGNTRTCGYVIDDVSHGEAKTIGDVVPYLQYSEYHPLEKPKQIFPSAIEFVPPLNYSNSVKYTMKKVKNVSLLDDVKRIFKYVPYYGIVLNRIEQDTFPNDSPVVLGDDAIFWRKVTNYYNTPRTGISCPKRYLWSSDPVTDEWCCSNVFREENIEQYVAESIDGKIVNNIDEMDSDLWIGRKYDPMTDFRPSSKKFPKRVFMVLFIYELLRQLYSQLNSHEHRHNTPFPNSKRFISDLVLTYPSSMTQAEKYRFRLQAAKAVNYFQKYYIDSNQRVVLHFDWDEGVASQISYISRKMSMKGVEFNLFVQQYNKEGDTLRIATLDFGGGTIDSAIVDFFESNYFGKVNYQLIKIDGRQIGGNELLRVTIVNFIFGQLYDYLASDIECQKRLTALRNGDCRDQLDRSKHIKFVVGFFLPLALAIIEKFAEENGDSSQNSIVQVEVDSVKGIDNELVTELHTYLHQGEEVEEHDLFSWKLSCSQTKLDEICESVFAPYLETLVNEISRNNPNIILLTGKLSCLPYFRKKVEEISKKMNAPGSLAPKIEIYQEIGSSNSSRSDPKLSVSLGASIAFCGKKGLSVEGLQYVESRNARNVRMYWGLIGRNDNRMIKLLFTPKQQGDIKTIDLSTGHYYIGCTMSDEENTELLRRYHLFVNQDCSVRLKRKFLKIDKTAAVYEECLELEDTEREVEMKPQTYTESSEWLDSGILEMDG